MEPVFYVFMSIFAAVVIAHLCFILFKVKLGADITKGFLMPLLLATLLAAGLRNGWIITGLVFATLGDLALLGQKKKEFFYLGIGLFSIMNICYTVTLFSHLLVDVSLWTYTLLLLLIVIIVIVSGAFIFPRYAKKAAFIMASYMGLLLVNLLFNGVYLIKVGTLPSIMLFIGSILFLTSDSMIGYDRFIAPLSYNRFFVMLTYISAQILLGLGFLYALM